MKGCFPLGPDLSRPSIPIHEYIKCWPTGNPTSQLRLPLPRPQRVRARALPRLERRQTLAFPPPFTKIFHHRQPRLARLPQIATSPGSHFSQIDPNLHSRRPAWLHPVRIPPPSSRLRPGPTRMTLLWWTRRRMPRRAWRPVRCASGGAPPESPRHRRSDADHAASAMPI